MTGGKTVTGKYETALEGRKYSGWGWSPKRENLSNKKSARMYAGEAIKRKGNFYEILNKTQKKCSEFDNYKGKIE